MLINRIKSFLYDQISTIVITVGLYYGWNISNAETFSIDYTVLFYCYLVSYTFQIFSLVIIKHNQTNGDVLTRIKVVNHDNSRPSKIKLIVYYMIFPIVLVNSTFMLYNLLLIIAYAPLTKDNDGKLDLLLSNVFKLKFIYSDSDSEQ